MKIQKTYSRHASGLVLPNIFIRRAPLPGAFTFGGDQAWVGGLKKKASGFTPVASGNLLGWYPLTENTGTTTADASGNGHAGTLLNSASWVTGVPSSPVSASAILCANTSSSFYTNSQSVDTGSSWADNLSNFTVSAQVKIPTSYTSGNNATIIGKISNGASNTGNGWILNCELNGPVAGGLVFFLQQGAGSTWIGGASTVAINDNAWHHCCATVSGGTTNSPTIVLYLDGVTTHTGAYSNGTWSGATGFSNTSHVILGNAITTSPANSNEPLDGTMADLRVYNIALTSTQVGQIHSLLG